MKFYSDKNMLVRISNKVLQRILNKKYITFNEDGVFETDNEILIKFMKPTFKFEEENKIDNEIDYKTMNYNELRKLAKEKGLELKSPSKEELINALEVS